MTDTKSEYYSYADMDGITTRNVIPQETIMTDEERRKLCAALRRKAAAGSWRVPICGEAADEIERLVKEVEIWKAAAKKEIEII